MAEDKCVTCGAQLQTQPGLSDEDLTELADLTHRASGLLNDPQLGIAQWGIMTSDVLNRISVIFKRSGI